MCHGFVEHIQPIGRLECKVSAHSPTIGVLPVRRDVNRGQRCRHLARRLAIRQLHRHRSTRGVRRIKIPDQCESGPRRRARAVA